MLSSTATSINFGPSIDSTDGLSESQKETISMSRYGSDGGSTTSLASCPEWKTIRTGRLDTTLCKEESSMSLDSGSSKRTRGDKMVRNNYKQKISIFVLTVLVHVIPTKKLQMSLNNYYMFICHLYDPSLLVGLVGRLAGY